MARRHTDEAWRAEVIERAFRRYSFAGRHERATAKLKAALAEAFDPMMMALARLLNRLGFR